MSRLGENLEAYEYTWKLADSRWAWEFLRRNSGFLTDVANSDRSKVSYRPACFQITLIRPHRDQTAAERWGLAFFPDPDHNGFQADAFWSPGIYDRAVRTHVGPRPPGDICEIYDRTVETCVVSHLTDPAGREHLLLKGNGCVIQALCSGMSILALEPVKLSFIIDSIEGFQTKLRTLERAQRVYGPYDDLEAPNWSRHSLALRNALIAFDCHEAGFSYLDTARFIYGEERATTAWSGASRAMKDEMKRALARGREMVNGGYAALLCDGHAAIAAE
jgi:hypothetical protein